MQQPDTFYTQQRDKHQEASKRLFKRMGVLSVLRLTVFVLILWGVYASFSQWQVAVGIGIVGMAVFLLLLSRYTDIKTQRANHKRLVAINQEELDIAAGHFHQRADGSPFQNPKHFYSLDIDLFGKGSFFQFMNRTSITERYGETHRAITQQ